MSTQTQKSSKEIELLAELKDGAKVVASRSRPYTAHEYRMSPGGDAVPVSLVQRLQGRGDLKGRITDNLGDRIEFILTERGRSRVSGD